MRPFAIVLAAAVMAACDASKPELEKSLARVQQISAEKDSLLRDVVATSQFISQVNSELAAVKGSGKDKPLVRAGDLPDTLTPAQAREAVQKRVAELVARVNESEKRLAASRQRVAQLTKSSADMKGQLAAFDSTVASFRTMVEGQKAQIATLTAQVDSLQAENTSLKTTNTTLKSANTQLEGDKAKLSAEKASLTSERNTVYYVVATRDQLLKSHLIEMTGGFLGLGKTPVPARNLAPADFTAIDRSTVKRIDFPAPDRSYRIITGQDVGALEGVTNATELRGGLRITDPERFWAASKFLIVVEN